MALDIVEEKTTTTESTDFEDDKYTVVFYNDSVTTFEFVTLVLCKVFGLSESEALNTALFIHKNGSKNIGEYSIDEAYAKVDEVDALKQKFHSPLLLTVEII